MPPHPVYQVQSGLRWLEHCRLWPCPRALVWGQDRIHSSFRFLARVGRNSSGWLPCAQIHSPPSPASPHILRCPCPYQLVRPVPRALQIGEAMFSHCQHLPHAHPSDVRGGQASVTSGCTPIHVRPEIWGAECEPHTWGGQAPPLSNRGLIRDSRR